MDGANWRTGGYGSLDGPDWGGLGRTGADGVEYRILEGADWGTRGGLGRTGRTGADWGGRGGLADWRTQRPGRGGLEHTGRIGRTGRTRADGGGWGSLPDRATRADGGGWGSPPDRADWGGRGGRGGLGRTRRTGGGGHLGSSLEGRKGRTGDYSGAAIPLLGVPRDSRSAKSGCGLWGHLAPYNADPHQILRCSCRRPLLGDSHFEGAKTLYQ